MEGESKVTNDVKPVLSTVTDGEHVTPYKDNRNIIGEYKPN